MERNIILTSVQINHKIRRIAYQIYETFVDQDEIVIAGISKNGYIFAEKIADALGEVSPIKPILC
jgi:pyrimidine operon attenuation protein/uracil phosphoribosyltransferase